MALDLFAQKNQVEAGVILACVGSLRRAVIRFADQPVGAVFEAPDDSVRFEIVSLIGTLSRHGEHYHISISDQQGTTIGGHLLDGCLVYTTAEIVIGILPGKQFLRRYCENSGYDELFVFEENG